MEVKIRRAKQEEMGQIAKIAQEEIYDELSVGEMENWLRGAGAFPYLQYFVAETDGKEIAGFIAWAIYDRYDPKIILDLAWLAVKSDYHRQGMGRRLVTETLQEMRRFWRDQQGLEISAVLVETDEDEDLLGFYRAVLAPTWESVVPRVWGKEGMVLLCRVFA